MKIKHLALAVALGLSLPSVALANTTTSSSSMRGVITTPTGQAAAGTKVTIVHVPTGTRTVVQTNESGLFNAVGLRVGGPYRVEIDSDVYTDRTINDIFIALGETAAVNVQLDQDSSVERIVVSARQSVVNFDMSGPSSVFNLEDIQNTPTIDRDIKSVIEQDPRITIDASNSNAIQCAGGTNRSNSLSVDGIRMNDNFGLNSNGYPTERLPFPFDAIDQVAVELAPFDVTYGGFSGCAINAVTISGTNSLSGSVFVDYRSDSLQGDKIEGRKINVSPFDEKRYGFTLGFPILENRLFGFVAVEKHNPNTVFTWGPTGAGFPAEISGLDVATVNRIAEIAKNVYGYNVNPLDTQTDNTEQKVLAKIDWQINQNHRSFLTFQNTKGDTTATTNSGSTSFAFDDHFYTRSNNMKSVAAQLYSDWTNDFSTVARIGWQDVVNGQVPRSTQGDFGQVQINGVNGNNRVFFGPDQFRHANELKYDTFSLKLEGKYFIGDHQLTAGVETESTDVFNMFVPNSKGVFTFASIDDFERKQASAITYSNAPSLDPRDGAAAFKVSTDTIYAQDKYTITPDLTLTFGLRWDRWSTDSSPNVNQNFATRYGFSNSNKLSVSLLQPRFGFNYVLDDKTVVYGGAGLFSGGNPNVWFSNSFSNDGVAVLSSSTAAMSATDRAFALDGNNTPNFGFAVPQLLTIPTYLRGGDGNVHATDPNLKAPGSWKFNLGLQREVMDDLMLGADIIYSKEKDPFIQKDLRLVQTGTAPDGRPRYSNCVTNVSNPSGACVSRSNWDLLLTNSNESATGKVVTFFSDWKPLSSLRVRAGYTYQSVDETHPMTSSTANSNYDRLVTDDPLNPRPATSNYETPHRFTLNLSYTADWFGSYKTRFSLFGQRVKGRAFSYTFVGDPGFGDPLGARRDRNLLYIPLVNDPKVVYGSSFNLDAFNQFIADNGLEKYRGQIAPRNDFNSSWWSRVDLKVTQDIPGFLEGHKGKLYFSIYNLGNLLNDDWGVRKQVGFHYQSPVVGATINDSNQYVFNTFRSPRSEGVLDSSSLWSMVLGLEYKF